MIITRDDVRSEGLDQSCNFRLKHSVLELKAIKKRLKTAFKTAPNAVAVASNQCMPNTHGEAPAAFFYKNKLYVNPTYTMHQYHYMTVRSEGCLSDPGVEHKVYRSNLIYVSYEIVKGNEIHKEENLLLRGTDAQVWQHEIDHLNGVHIWENTRQHSD